MNIPMELQTLGDRAMEIRARYAAFEKARSGKEWTPSELMEGFVVDVGELMRLVMAKSGNRDVDNVDEKLAHELSDCLWCVLVLSRLYGVDLEQAFLKTMDDLDTSLCRKLPTKSIS